MFSEIAKYIDNVGVGRHGYCFVTDKNGDIVYHPQQQLLFSGLKTENTDLISSLPDGTHTEKGVIYTAKSTKDNLWRIVGISFTNELAAKAETADFYEHNHFIPLLCIDCADSSDYLLAHSNRPVKSMIQAMKRFEVDAENFKFSGGTESVTEFNVLSRSFEHMSQNRSAYGACSFRRNRAEKGRA